MSRAGAALRLAVLASPVALSAVMGAATPAAAAVAGPLPAASSSPEPSASASPGTSPSASPSASPSTSPTASPSGTRNTVTSPKRQTQSHRLHLVVPAAVHQAAATGPAGATTDTTGAGATSTGGTGSTDTTTDAGTSGVGPTPVATPAAPSTPGAKLSAGGLTSNPIGIAVLLGALTIVPAALMTMTAFTRIVIVLGFTRSALSTQSVPPNQVIIGLSLFLTMFVMGPTFGTINHDAVQPYLHGQISSSQAYDRGIEPLREFMLKQVRAKDLSLFTSMDGKPTPTSPDQVPTTALIPAFILSELREAFIIGFVVFLPFLIIDLIVSAALSSLGMMMLPPVLVSLPFKLLLFVAVDGWYLVVGSLMKSFHS